MPLLIIDDFGMRKLPLTAAEDLLEIVMRRYERASTPETASAWAVLAATLPAAQGASTRQHVVRQNRHA